MTVFHVFVIAAHSAILLTPMVETEPPNDDYEPRCELASSVISIRTKTMKVVPAKLAENEGVAIHDVIVIPTE